MSCKELDEKDISGRSQMLQITQSISALNCHMGMISWQTKQHMMHSLVQFTGDRLNNTIYYCL